jgi:hypothetical protein
MPREAGFNDLDNGLVVFRSLQEQPVEAFQAAFKAYIGGQKMPGFSMEKVNGTEQTGLLHEARQVLKGTRKTVTDVLSKGIGSTAASIVNPVPGTPTDVGQLGGAATGLALGSLLGPLGGAAGAVIGGGLGRMGGSMLEEEPQPFTEGAMGLAGGLLPTALRGGAYGARTVNAVANEKRVVKGVLSQLDEMMPQGAPKLSRDIPKFQEQISATGKNSLAKWGQQNFRGELDKINGLVGNMQVRIPSLGPGPVKVSDVLEEISGKGQRLVHGVEPKTFGQKVAAVGQRKIVEELDYVLRQNGLDAVADTYLKARNDLHRVNEIVRLFKTGSESKRPLDLSGGRIELSKLQEQFLKIREQGGLKPFTDDELHALETILGRGRGLAGTDKPFDMPGLVSMGVATGKSTGLRIAAPSLPKAAGIRYQPPSAAERIMLPAMLGQQLNEER